MGQPKPNQSWDYFVVGDKVHTNSFHNLFYEMPNPPADEHKAVGTVVAVGPNGVTVDWVRRVRYPTHRPEAPRSCYCHLPMFLDKFDPFQSKVMAYLARELGS